MKYIPMKDGNKWTTNLCSINGNQGIHDQSQFKSAVEMLEQAVATWIAPRLIHIILTGATVSGYALFIDHMKRHMPRKAYKAAIEVDSHKGQHVHWMLIVDASSSGNLFDLGDDSSAANKVMRRIQRAQPDFNVTVAQPYKHPTPFIPLSEATLHDAVEWFSYALKSRSKPSDGKCYWSSRGSPAFPTCTSHRPARLVKQKYLCDGEFSNKQGGKHFLLVPLLVYLRSDKPEPRTYKLEFCLDLTTAKH
jgi:hypothetical protein